jgi:serine/threonine-protein kinase
MGEVYLARQVSLNRPVALKVLREALALNPTYLSRFEVEATAVARLNHPNIVQIYTLGKEGDLRFIAMEYVQGTNLKDYLVKKGSVDLNLGLSIMRQTALAIEAAGELGLIHRDIKPENLLLTRKGQVKVADFGLVREQGSESLHLTQEGITLGTPMYMSPEQVRGKALDHRSDLYSMGVTFYHMFAGVTPFRGESALAVALKHVQETPASLAVHRPDLPQPLVDLVMRLMAKEPEKRPATAKELLREIARVRDTVAPTQAGLPVGATEAIPLPAPAVDSPAPTPTPRAVRPKGPPLGQRLAGLRPSNGLIAAVSLLGLLGGGMMGWMARAPDLLAPDAPPARGPAALWIEPRWAAVEKKATPRDQLRHAQLLAREADRAAAFLAVAGHFPDQQDWALAAYIQLARHFLSRGDATRLADLAGSLQDAPAEPARQLSALAAAAAAALEDRAPAARDRLTSLNNIGYLNPPALAEFALEVVETTQASPTGAAMGAAPWANLRGDLLEAIGMETPERLNILDPPRRGVNRPGRP